MQEKYSFSKGKSCLGDFMKKSYKIVASDLDGTFLGKDQTVSLENTVAIAKMRKLGVEFVPATGRTLSEIPHEIMQCSDIRYIITSDGAAVWDKNAEKMIITRYIPSDIVKFILDTLKSCNSYPLAHKNGKNYYDVEKHITKTLDYCRVGDYFRYIINKTAYSATDFCDFLINSKDVEMFCIFFEKDDDLEKCKQIFLDADKLCVAQSDPHNLEVFLSVAGKGNALKALSDAIDVDISNTVAVGDSTNDISLIKAAGLGLAMENACAALKIVADKVICNNDGHSAKYILDNFILDN